MRYLGLDLGTKTLGVSISDPTGLIASSYTIIRHNEEYDRLITDVKNIVLEKNVQEIVLGLPKNMNNTLGEKARLSYEFKKKLEDKLNIKVHLVDERLSTVEAERALIGADMSRKNRKEVIDSVAASIILDTYLKRIGSGR